MDIIWERNPYDIQTLQSENDYLSTRYRSRLLRCIFPVEFPQSEPDSGGPSEPHIGEKLLFTSVIPVKGPCGNSRLFYYIAKGRRFISLIREFHNSRFCYSVESGAFRFYNAVIYHCYILYLCFAYVNTDISFLEPFPVFSFHILNQIPVTHTVHI